MPIPSSVPLQYLPRLSDAALVRAMATSPIVLVDGPRAVGKTTSAARLAASALRLPKDFERLTADPEATLRDLARPVLIDEWQLAGIDLLWTLKGIVDADPTPGQFLLAGSVEPATYGPTFPLIGRVTRVVMRPMNRAELEGHGAARSFLERTVDGERPQPTAGRRAGAPPSRLTRCRRQDSPPRANSPIQCHFSRATRPSSPSMPATRAEMRLGCSRPCACSRHSRLKQCPHSGCGTPPISTR